MPTMKAALRRQYGSPEQITIEKVERPVPKPNEVLLKVHATTINRTDCAILAAEYFVMRFYLGLFRPRQVILGTDVAGEVVAVGQQVRNYQVGDRVFAFQDEGLATQAEYVAVAENEVVPIPLGVNYEQAAASLEGAHYAYGFLQNTAISNGQHVLVNGATGAIGSALLQMIRQYDVQITATCRETHFEVVKELGADNIYDYTKEDVMQQGEKFDIVFDAVGKRTFGQSKPAMKPKSAYISSELGPYGQNIGYALMTMKSNQRKVIFPLPKRTIDSIPYISSLLEKKQFRPLIDRTYQLNQVKEAYEYVMSGQKVGNVVLKLSQKG